MRGWLGLWMARNQNQPRASKSAELDRLYADVCRLRATVEMLEAQLKGSDRPAAKSLSA